MPGGSTNIISLAFLFAASQSDNKKHFIYFLVIYLGHNLFNTKRFVFVGPLLYEIKIVENNTTTNKWQRFPHDLSQGLSYCTNPDVLFSSEKKRDMYLQLSTQKKIYCSFNFDCTNSKI